MNRGVYESLDHHGNRKFRRSERVESKMSQYLLLSKCVEAFEGENKHDAERLLPQIAARKME